MSGGFDSGTRSKGDRGNADASKAGIDWRDPSSEQTGATTGHGDAGASERTAALRQIHRSLKAWRSQGEEQAQEHGSQKAEEETVQRKIFRAPDAGNDDDWRRQPDSLQEQMALAAAKAGAGDVIIPSLNDPRYKGMAKKEYKVTSKEGAKVCVHYVFDPKTGKSMDFKFKETSKPPGIGRKAKE